MTRIWTVFMLYKILRGRLKDLWPLILLRVSKVLLEAYLPYADSMSFQSFIRSSCGDERTCMKLSLHGPLTSTVASPSID